MSKKTFYITTPIYYPSGDLHIGHVYTTTLAWVLKNYKSEIGYDAIFLTGADEHGQKIQQKSESLNLSPQEYVDQMTDKFKNLWTKLDIRYDIYSRTTNPSHQESVKKQFTNLFNNGDVYKGEYKGLYSVQDEEFVVKNQIEERDGKFYHAQSKHELVEVSEESYFFKMNKYEEWLKDYLNTHKNFIYPASTTHELFTNFLNNGISELSVTRSTFDWGIQIEQDESHVIYVWLDALNNYITALGYNTDENSDFVKYWEKGDEIVHIVGKEITRFHCIYWPIILKANNLRLPTKIISHGWIVTPEGKMSKSKGNVIDPVALIDTFGAEAVKYYFASKINIGSDATFSTDIMRDVYNSDLANTIGNLVSRTISMYKQNFEEPIKFNLSDDSNDKAILLAIENHFNNYKKYFDDLDPSSAFDEMLLLAKELNLYIDLTKPWTLKENKDRLSQVLNNLFNGIYAIATMLKVVMPRKAEKIRYLLNINFLRFASVLEFSKFNDVVVNDNEILFERMK